MNIVTIDFYNRDIFMENSNDRKADLLKNSGNYYVICSDFMGFFFFTFLQFMYKQMHFTKISKSKIFS